jgi:double-stranded uracil-DNA glycosylase
LHSAVAGHHFAGPANRFWPTLHASGFTPRRFAPAEERLLLRLGLGITNLVARATASADEVSPDELRAGALLLQRKVVRYRPRFVAFVGLGAFRIAFRVPDAPVGPSPLTIGHSAVWVLPNPSGLNAHYQPAQLRDLFLELRLAVSGR